MQIFGLEFDIFMLIAVFAFVTFWGAILAAVFIFADINPYLPRKYYKIKLLNKDGKPLRDCKGWIISKSKVKWFRIGLRDFPNFKGVEKDIATMETMNEKGIIEIIEDVPDKYEPENYTPKNIPLTQSEKYDMDVLENVIKPLCIQEYEENGEKKQGYNQGMIDYYTLKMKDARIRNSRLVDLNTSRATKEYISQARREAERIKGDDFISKYGPTIILVFACLFAYLILDGAGKSYQATMAQQSAVMEHGYSQVIQQCGGVYHPLVEQTNKTTVKTSPIPFMPT